MTIMIDRSFLYSGFLRIAVVVLIAASFTGWSWKAPLARSQVERPLSYPFVVISDYDRTHAYIPEKRWQRVARPGLMGWSRAKLDVARTYSNSLDTSAVVIVENGVIVEAWGEITKRLRSHSMRKSFLSVLFGPPVADGRIKLSATMKELGIDDVPPLTPGERLATVSDLLTSRSGIYHSANFETKSMRRKRPPRESHPPGTFWYYNNWDFNALGTIYERSTGEGIFDAFRRLIAGPLRMEHFRRKDAKYYNKGNYSIHPAYRFRMSALDLARLGLLFLRKGSWKGRQIIPASWVEESTRAHLDRGRKGSYPGYGYMWWVGEKGYAAVGKSGQRLIVMPKRNLLIVHLVNTREKGRRVKSSRLRNLVGKIVAAKETFVQGAMEGAR
jgi:CubicO group peptidase (beta-lactamase class C family)